MMATKKIILGGFSAIKWQDDVVHPHRESTKEKGQKLVESGHVFDVKEIRENGTIEFVGFCVKETNIRDKPYKITLSLDSARSVQDARCQCIAGVKGDCKHTAGLVYYINNERQESKTDQKCNWRTPSQYGQKLYPKGKTFDEIFGFKQPRAKFLPPSQADQVLHKELVEKHGGTNSMMYQMLNAEVRSSGFLLDVLVFHFIEYAFL